MNIIIPLGGVGQRFQDEGYILPKPLINVLGKHLIFYVLDSIKLEKDDAIFIIYNIDLDKWDFKDIISNKYPFVNFIQLPYYTRGAAETLLYGLERINNNNKKIMTLDCDNFYSVDVLSQYRHQQHNAVFCFYDTSAKPIYSYVNVDNDNYLTEVKEKVKISNYANTGCYCFANILVLIDYCRRILNEGTSAKELYISCVIDLMMIDNHKFKMNLIDASSYHCLGTPIQLKLFAETSKIYNDKYRFCFDLDNTLVTYPKIKNDYASVMPITKNIEYLRFLKSLGHTIIIYTARRMKTHNGNVGKIVQDVGSITLNTLSKFDIPYDELYFGKPYADFYIDDLAVNARANLEKEIGFYKTKVNERSHNSITNNVVATMIKKGNPTKIKGEIHYYENIPMSLRKYFPKLYSYDDSDNNNVFYEMEKIDGIAMSYLYINENLCETLFCKYLDTLYELHTYKPKSFNDDITGINIYDNYCNKLESRYKSYNYSEYNDSVRIYNELHKYFQNYENKKHGMIGIIHGDTVFSNCLVNALHELKLIDMRGMIGDKYTIYGDILYDYGKIYQSLIGYDEIMLGKKVNNHYRNHMIDIFWKWINAKYESSYSSDDNDTGNTYAKKWINKTKMSRMQKNIIYIAYQLIFTLIPFHDEKTELSREKCQAYFDLIHI